MVDRSLGEGVYYSHDDYPGLVRRFCVVVIDLGLLVLTGVLIASGLTMFPSHHWRLAATIGLLFWLLQCFLYLTVMKRSRFRTLGYRVCRVQLVSSSGSRPSMFAMTFRLMIWLFGPINLLFDLVWIGADEERQSLRDCYACTLMIRLGAKPIGKGPIHLTRFCGAGLTLVYPRVVRP